MIRIEEKLTVRSVHEKKWEDKVYYTCLVEDAEGDIYEVNVSKRCVKGDTLSLAISPSTRKENKYRPVVSVKLDEM